MNIRSIAMDINTEFKRLLPNATLIDTGSGEHHGDADTFAVGLGKVLDNLKRISTWQPIESAPKDGTQILAWNGFYKRYTTIYWGDINADDCREPGHIPNMGWLYGNDKHSILFYRQWHYLTHWMLPPEPPCG